MGRKGLSFHTDHGAVGRFYSTVLRLAGCCRRILSPFALKLKGFDKRLYSKKSNLRKYLSNIGIVLVVNLVGFAPNHLNMLVIII